MCLDSAPRDYDSAGVRWGPVMCFCKRDSEVLCLLASSPPRQHLTDTWVFPQPGHCSAHLWNRPSCGRVAYWPPPCSVASLFFLSNYLQCFTVRCSAAAAREEDPDMDSTVKVRTGSWGQWNGRQRERMNAHSLLGLSVGNRKDLKILFIELELLKVK